MDFYSPKLSNKLFPATDKKGLSNYIMKECKLEDILQQTEQEMLQFVAAGNAEGQRELFYNDSMLTEFINWAKQNYDLVIFDTPAAMYIPDIVEFFDQMDSILIIARLRRTNRKVLDKLFKILNVFNNKHIAVILNDLYLGGIAQYDNYGYNNYYDSTKDESLDSNKSKIKRPKKSIIFLITLLLVVVLAIYLFLFVR